MRERTNHDIMSPREREEFEQDKLIAEMQTAHSLEIKKLELEVARLEVKWSSMFRIPVYIIMLPVRFLFGIAFIVATATKQKLPPEFWNFMK